MQVRWTAAAADDLEQIADYLFRETPQHATRLIRSLYDAVFALRTFLMRGRPGKKAGTRELVIQSTPYVVVYQLGGDVVYVARILHGAQKWPE
jgi:toxin ParE1/3/4